MANSKKLWFLLNYESYQFLSHTGNHLRTDRVADESALSAGIELKKKQEMMKPVKMGDALL